MAQTQERTAKTATRPIILTHGTLEIQDVQESMRFYRDFLGMDVIQHVPMGCRISLGSEFYIVCLEVKHEHDMPLLNHWGLDTASKEEVDAWYERALAEKEEYGLRAVQKPRSLHGAYSFYLQDRDHNWWEIQYYEGDAHETHLRWGQTMLAKGEERRKRMAEQAAARGELA